MSFFELMERRVSVRGYKDTPIDDELILKVLEAGRMAPSAANRQPWYFVVVKDEFGRKTLGKAYPKEWFAAAPVIIAVAVNANEAWTRCDGVNYSWVDAAIAMDHITLAATELGLGTCWIGAFDPQIAEPALNLPKNFSLVAMTPLGYPDDDGREKKRKNINDVVFWEKYKG